MFGLALGYCGIQEGTGPTIRLGCRTRGVLQTLGPDVPSLLLGHVSRSSRFQSLAPVFGGYRVVVVNVLLRRPVAVADDAVDVHDAVV